MKKSTSKNSPEDFCVFILTHGRPDKVITFDTLKKSGYDGPVFIIVDNEDKTLDEYFKKFGDKVIVFDKSAIASKFDEFDNFNDRRAIIYARNACFEIANKLGYRHFIEFDDDYTHFGYRVLGLPVKTYNKSNWLSIKTTLGEILRAMFEFYESIPALSIAFSQGGDWFGGNDAFSRRKCMNTFFCSTERPFQFVGRINEDVNTYTWFQSQGNLFLTIPWIQMCQKQTQKTKGGMTDIYLNGGTYVKSFYTVICSPSCVGIEIMGTSGRRIHHKINWDCAVPQIIEERYRK